MLGVDYIIVYAHSRTRRSKSITSSQTQNKLHQWLDQFQCALLWRSSWTWRHYCKWQRFGQLSLFQLQLQGQLHSGSSPKLQVSKTAGLFGCWWQHCQTFGHWSSTCQRLGCTRRVRKNYSRRSTLCTEALAWQCSQFQWVAHIFAIAKRRWSHTSTVSGSSPIRVGSQDWCWSLWILHNR